MNDVVPVTAPEITGAGDSLAAQLALEMEADLFTAAMDQAALHELPTDQGFVGDPVGDIASTQATVLPAGEQTDLGDGIATQLWNAFVDVDSGYQAIFPLGDSANGSPSFRTGDPELLTQSGKRLDASAPDLARLMEQSVEVSLWSVQVNLLTSGVKRSTDGVQTLFRNSG